MNASTPLWKAHDISQQLQDKIEVLPNVERAFVHVDHETDHAPVRIILQSHLHILIPWWACRNIEKAHCLGRRDSFFEIIVWGYLKVTRSRTFHFAFAGCWQLISHETYTVKLLYHILSPAWYTTQWLPCHILILAIPRSYSAIRSNPAGPLMRWLTAAPCHSYPAGCWVYLRSWGSRTAQCSMLRDVSPDEEFDTWP